MSKETIYKALIDGGLNHIGACAIMGNMMCESALKANNAQDGMTTLSDEEYTDVTDWFGNDFENDQIGYGLCQWTHPSRKKAMFEYHKARNVSIGDEDTQVQFCLWELKNNYKELYDYLCDADSLYRATQWVMKLYENPAIYNFEDRFNAAIKIGKELEAKRLAAIEYEGSNESESDGDLVTLAKLALTKANELTDILERMVGM